MDGCNWPYHTALPHHRRLTLVTLDNVNDQRNILPRRSDRGATGSAIAHTIMEVAHFATKGGLPLDGRLLFIGSAVGVDALDRNLGERAAGKAGGIFDNDPFLVTLDLN
jgi:hypothetical protein